MRTVFTIAARELRSFLSSPIAWVVIALFLFIFGGFFWIFLTDFANRAPEFYQFAANPAYAEMLAEVNLTGWVVSPLFGNTQILFLLLVPALTMRLFAEEKKQGTYEFLLTSPLSVAQLVAGKYLAGLAMIAILLLCSAVFPASLYLIGTPDTAVILTGYLGLFLLGGAFVAVGTFASSITENQIIAAVLTFATLLVFWLITWAQSFVGGTAADLISSISFLEHFEDFIKGVLDTRHLVYFAGFIAFFLLLTGRAVEAVRWKR
jgi:ABC-2 type transport system permease protein